MGKKVTVIGAGNVGATIAYAMTVAGTATEIVIVDIDTEKALGVAMDIWQGTPMGPAVDVYAGDYAAAAGSEVVVITSGIPRKPGQSRIDLTKDNVAVMRQIIPQITKAAPDALYVMVSNPVDILTYLFCKESDIPVNRVMGTGTLLDTTRLRTTLADHLGISPSSIDAFTLGEHGDSMVFPWSLIKVGGVDLNDYDSFQYPLTKGNPPDKAEIEEYVRTSGAQIIKRKGATYQAIAACVNYLVHCLLGSMDTVMPISAMLYGEYGINDVCFSIPRMVGPEGVKGSALPELTEDELAGLHHSADVLKAVIKDLGIQ